VRCEDIDLFFEVFDIAAQLLFFGSENYIAATEVAGTSAKREVDIEGEFFCTIFKVIQILFISKVFTELQRGRITGVSWPGFGVFAIFF
jgi:hypothetical protein